MYIPFVRIVVSREHAKQLALSGLQYAIANVAFVPKKEKEPSAFTKVTADKQDAKLDKDFIAQEAIARFVPAINQWQTIELDDLVDGITGKLQICFMSEEGKININRVYDFEKKKFVGERAKGQDWKIILQELFKQVEKITNAKNLFAAFESILKKRDVPFDDVTELLQNKIFSDAFGVRSFYDPKQPGLYLTDLFTTFSSDMSLDVWLLSDALCKVLGIARASTQSTENRKAHIEKIKKNLKQEYTWNLDWKPLLQPLYEQDIARINKIFVPLFQKSFDPKVLSVRIHATVGRAIIRLYAILERNERAENGQIVYDVRIKRFYWL